MLTYPFVLVSNLMAVNNCGWVGLADYLLLWLLLSVRPNRVILPLSPQACWWPATLCISVSHLGGLLEASKQRGKCIQTLEKCRCHEKHWVSRMQRVHYCQFWRQLPQDERQFDIIAKQIMSLHWRPKRASQPLWNDLVLQFEPFSVEEPHN